MLNLHNSCSSRHNVALTWKLTNNSICFDFVIMNYTPNQNIEFSKNYKENWGLWDTDVAEVFIKKDDSSEYLELQSSPLNQPFALMIEVPREKYYSPDKLDFKISNIIKEYEWNSCIEISLDSIPGNSKTIVGNCFVCLGNKDNREYFALNINLDKAPDFHKPELFVELEELK